MGQGGVACPKPEPRARTKRRAQRQQMNRDAFVRAEVFEREQGICRCCRSRRAESRHEIRFRSLGGKVTRANCIAVCGDGVRGCHGFLQRLQIVIEGPPHADGLLYFVPMTQRAAEHMKLVLGTQLESGPTPQIRGEVEL